MTEVKVSNRLTSRLPVVSFSMCLAPVQPMENKKTDTAFKMKALQKEDSDWAVRPRNSHLKKTFHFTSICQSDNLSEMFYVWQNSGLMASV